jgi:ABC-type branched-subunit amino acid transport system ATPase component
MSSLLDVVSLTVGYRPGIDILRDLDLRVDPGAVTAVIGSNGAGKSTLLKALFGVVSPRGGSVVLDGTDITRLTSDARKALGIAYLPQHHSTFPHLSVEQNLRLGAWLLRRDKQAVRRRLDHVFELFPVLRERRGEHATTLSGGQLRQLAVAKEIIVPARLLLVDEPSVGMAPNIAEAMYELLRRLAEEGLTVLLVDQSVTEAIELATTAHLMTSGRIVRSGPGEWFRAHLDQVVAEMLGSTPAAQVAVTG